MLHALLDFLNSQAGGSLVTGLVVGAFMLLRQKHIVNRAFDSVPADVLHLLRDAVQVRSAAAVPVIAGDLGKIVADVVTAPAAPIPVSPTPEAPHA